MTDDEQSRVTRLLRELAQGRRDAEAELIPLVYGELHRIAHHLMRGERGHHTLQTTALVHEAYLRLAGPRQQDWQDRTHFFRVAAKVMRQILVDHARSRQAQKRGAGVVNVFVEPLDAWSTLDDMDRILVVNEALTKLWELDEHLALIIELRFFVGLTIEEIAEVFQLSTRTIKRDYRLARAQLAAQLAS